MVNMINLCYIYFNIIKNVFGWKNYRRRGRQESPSHSKTEGCYTADSEDGGMSHKPQNVGRFYKMEKARLP